MVYVFQEIKNVQNLITINVFNVILAMLLMKIILVLN